MKKYLLPQNGNFYKANLHCHTTCSDGRKTPEEIKEIYKSLGYSIVAYTDHNILISHDDLNDDTFLALHGFEMDINEQKAEGFSQIKTCHICFIGLEPDNILQPFWHREQYVWGNALKYREQVKFDENEPDYERKYSHKDITDIMTTAREKGFFVTYNHPTWSLEDYSDYIGYSGMHAMEIFNGGCNATGYDDYNPRVYDDILRSGKKIYCVGTDDNHNGHELGSRHCDSGWAYTVIKAESLEYRNITKALQNGNFYASEGPEIYELWYEDGKVHIKCSDADKITCNYGTRFAGVAFSENGLPVNEAEFEVKPELGFFRITVFDKTGKHACTNAYFPEDIM